MSKKNFVRQTAGFLIIAATSISATATMPPISTKLYSRFGMTLEGLYVRQTNSDMDYSYLTTTTPTASTTAATVKPYYYGAFRLSADMALADESTNVRFSWLHFNQSYRSTISGQSIVPIYSPSTEFYDDFNSGSGNLSTRLEALDLDIGQIFPVKEYLNLRLFTGIRYAHLSNDLTNSVNNSLATGTSVATTQSISNSSFNGLGPLFGLASTYDIGGHFSLVTNAAAAVLMGNVSANYAVANITAAGVNTTATIPTSTTTRLIPGFDGKLGINFSHNIGQRSQVNIEAGYQTTYYFEVVDRFHITGPVAAAVEINSISRTTSNFGLSGPYLSINYNLIC